MRIVVAEDNRRLADAVARVLRRAGHAVEELHDGLDADEHLSGGGADLVILDMNLPRLSGLEILRALRRRGDTVPVLVLTARGDVPDRVAGLDAGADDYMVKPFPMDELVARVRALARRRAQIAPCIDRVGTLEYDRGTGMVTVAGAGVDLSPRERALFDLLFEHAGRVVTKARIRDTLYGQGAEVEPNAAELAVSRLRRKLGAGASIRTIRGLGYLLEGEPGG